MEAGPAAGQSLAQHLGDVIDHFTNFRNTVDSARRQNLLNALRKVQAEAAAQGTPVGANPSQTALNIARLPSASELAESMGIREMLGTSAYEAFDHQWAESVLNYYQTGKNRVAFPTHAALDVNPVQNLPDDGEIRIAIAGDSGCDNRVSAPAAVARFMQAKNPHYTIHLGDVYYSGLGAEETHNFLSVWPAGPNGSYTLNSNHEMYCGGTGYFNTLLGNVKFGAQRGLSYFALTNQHWLIVGLDTAYFAYYQSLLYEEGWLYESDANKIPNGMVQYDWFRQLLAEHRGKRVMILTHHDGFDVNPANGKVTRKPLFQQVRSAMSGVSDWWWYFGHVHAPIVYKRLFFPGNSCVSARCVGHGAVPYEPFPRNLERLGDGSVMVEWAETDLARNGGDARRAPNGFLLLTLRGAEVQEELYDELNRKRWANF